MTFVTNLEEGTNYYKGLFSDLKGKFKEMRSTMLNDFDEDIMTLMKLKLEIVDLSRKLN